MSERDTNVRMSAIISAYAVERKQPQNTKSEKALLAERRAFVCDFGAGKGIRTLDVNLGKVALYH